jgi:hypothetical protein
MKSNFLFHIFLFLFLPVLSQAQINDSSMILFSGIVITADSLTPIPYANIKIQGTSRNVVSNVKGLFSINACKNNTLVFSCLGFKTDFFKIPDSVSKNHYIIVQRMQADTLVLDETDILQWPTYEQFKCAFVSTEVNKSEMDRARKNLEQIQKSLYTAYLSMDSESNYRRFTSAMWKRACSKGQRTMLFTFAF